MGSITEFLLNTMLEGTLHIPYNYNLGKNLGIIESIVLTSILQVSSYTINNSNHNKVRLSLSKFINLLNITSEELLMYINKLNKLNLIKSNVNGNIITIESINYSNIEFYITK